MSETMIINVKGVNCAIWERNRRLARQDGATMAEWLDKALTYYADACESMPREMLSPRSVEPIDPQAAATLLTAFAAVAASGQMNRDARSRMNRLVQLSASTLDGLPVALGKRPGQTIEAEPPPALAAPVAVEAEAPEGEAEAA